MTLNDDVARIARGLRVLADQADVAKAKAIDAATRARAAIESATEAESRAIEAQALGGHLRDSLRDIATELEALSIPEPGPVPEPGPGPEPDPVPDPDPGFGVLVSGPPSGVSPARSRGEFHQLFRSGPALAGAPFRGWQSKAGYDNNAGEWFGYEGGVAVQMNPAHGSDPNKRAGSSESHEAWMYWDRRYREAAMDLELKLVDPFSWPLTGKVAGIVGWNGDWSQWPGGGRSGPDNASVRLILNDWGHVGEARLGAYVYLGGVFDQDETTGHRANYVSNGGHSVEYLIHDYGVPRAGTWIPVRFEVSTGADGYGDLVATIEGREVLTVGRLPWFVGGSDRGWNTSYVCGLFGGDSPEYNPQGGSRTIAYRGARWSGR